MCAPFIGAGNYYSYTSTIGVLALILVYIGVGGAETVEAWRDRRPIWSALHLGAGPAAVGALPQYLSGAGVPQ